MSQNSNRRFPILPSSDSELSDDNQTVSSNSSVVTSFESVVSAKTYKTGKKKNIKSEEKSSGREKSEVSTSLRRRLRTSKEIKRPHGSKQRHSIPNKSEKPKNISTYEPVAETRNPKKNVTKSSKKKSKISSSNKNMGNKNRSGTYSRPIRDYESDRENERNTRERSSNYDRYQIAPGPSRTSKVLPTVPDVTARRKPSKPRKNRVLSEIRKCQRETKLLLAKLPFARVVREITASLEPGLRWQVLALEAIQEAAEIYLVHLFEDSILCTIHRSRLTLNVTDMRLARRIRSRFENF